MAIAVPAYAAGAEKLGDGFKMFLKSPLQITDNIKSEWEAAELKPIGAVGGALKGLFYAGRDMIHGLFDVLTFPVDL